jgi:hypothetical protein
MTDSRAALVEKVRTEVKQLSGTHLVTPEIQTAIDLIRAEVLEEAAKEADKWWGQDLLAAAIRALKGDSNDV